jgi:hypothetical protein
VCLLETALCLLTELLLAACVFVHDLKSVHTRHFFPGCLKKCDVLLSPPPAELADAISHYSELSSKFTMTFRAEIIIPGGDVRWGYNIYTTHQLFIKICYKKGGSTGFTDDQRALGFLSFASPGRKRKWYQ